jgi:hypothetical protein
LAEPGSARIEAVQDFVKPRVNAIAVDFGQVVQVKAVYLEKREPPDTLHLDTSDQAVRRHFGLLATSAIGISGMTAEGELAYSQLDASGESCVCKERPMMRRLAFRNRWEALNYGADYRSYDSGFVSVAGARTDLQRDEGEIWGERTWGPLGIRGSLTQVWENPLDATGVRLTRSAGATFNYARSQWRGSFASTYSMVGQDPLSDRETTIANHAIIASYRPTSSVSLAPSFSLKREWNSDTGVHTETPATGVAFVYAPFKDSLRLTSDTSLSRTFSMDGTSDVRTFGTGAAVEWKVGKFIGAVDRLSFSVNYNQRMDLVSQGGSQSDVRGMLRLQVTGF